MLIAVVRAASISLPSYRLTQKMEMAFWLPSILLLFSFAGELTKRIERP
jgi:hypothetical protein